MLSAKQVAPGGSGEIEVNIRTEGVAALNKTVTVTTNDPRQPRVVLGITAVVQKEFALSEPMIYFGSVPKGTEVTKKITVSVAPERDVTVLEARSTVPAVAVSLEPVQGSKGKQFTVTAVQKPDTKEGYHSGFIVLKTTSKLNPEVRVMVRGIIKPQAAN